MKSLQLAIFVLLFGVSLVFSQTWSVLASGSDMVKHPQTTEDHMEHDALGDHQGAKHRVVFYHEHEHEHEDGSGTHRHAHCHEVPCFGSMSFIQGADISELNRDYSPQFLSSTNNIFIPRVIPDAIFRPPISS